MTEGNKNMDFKNSLEYNYHTMPVYQEEDDEIDLLELWQTISKHKKFIIAFTLSITIISVIVVLLMINIYKSSSVILPIQQGDKGESSLLSQFGGAASLAGLSLTSSGGSQQIMAILKSDSLKIETIKKYNLLPVILYKSWDKKHKKWIEKKGWFSKNKNQFFSKQQIRMANALKSFSNMMSVSNDKTLGTITISVEYPNPMVSTELVRDILSTLKNRMVKETIDVAKKRETILKSELMKTQDPTIQQKLYGLVAKQKEIIATAKVGEDFAFKIIDPPQIPVFKYKPKRKLIVIVAFITGLILSIFIVFFVEFVKNAKDRQKKVKEEA